MDAAAAVVVATDDDITVTVAVDNVAVVAVVVVVTTFLATVSAATAVPRGPMACAEVTVVGVLLGAVRTANILPWLVRM